MQIRANTQQLISECIEQGITLHDLEREFIELALEKAKDSRIVVAKQVGVHVRTLYKKMDKFQLKRFYSIPVMQKDVALSAAQKLGIIIFEARKRKGLEPKELAYFLGYKSVSSVCHIERGRRSIPVRLLPRISTLLNIPIQQLKKAHLEVALEKG